MKEIPIPTFRIRSTLVFWLCAAAVGNAFAGTPKIKFDKTFFDFGTTSQVQQVAGKFTYQNVGNDVLKLDRPTTTCGCTVASLKPDTLQPGEKGELGFTLNVGPHRSTLVKHIIVTSNDPQNPKVQLMLQAQYVPLFDLTPPNVYLDNFRLGTVTNASFTIKRTDGKKLNLAKAEVSNSWIQVKTESSATDDKSGRILLELRADGSPRRFYEPVRVFAEDSKEPVYTFTISGRVVGEVSWSPEVVYWAINEASLVNGQLPENLSRRWLQINSTTPGKAVEIKNVTSNLKQLQTEVKSLNNGANHQLTAKLTEVPKSTMTGTISFETDLPNSPRFEVPVTISFQAKPALPPSPPAVNVEKK